MPVGSFRALPPSSQLEIRFPSTAGVEAIAAAGDQNLTERLITIVPPIGATIQRVMLLADITAMNDTATAHKIDLEVQGRAGAGAWNSLIDLADNIGFAAADGATTGHTFMLDVSALVVAAGAYGFRFVVNQSGGANSVRYTSGFCLIVCYSMA